MLRFENIRFSYPGADLCSLDDVSLEVPAGEAFGLLGPNGAGKTTLISLAAGLLPLQQGTVLLGGEPLHLARARNPRQVALVPQDNAFYPKLTVRENLRFFAQAQGLQGRLVKTSEEYALAFAQLEGFTHRRGGQLSGGLKRRLNLAIALLTDPALLLLDEPTVGVDPQSRHFLLSAIGGLQRAGRTIIYTSHYMDEIEALCGYVAILDQGKVLLKGSMSEVLSAAPPLLAMRLDNALPAELAMAWTERFTLQHLPGHRINLLGVIADEVPSLLEALRAAGLSVDAWSYGQQHLDDVFMHFTQRALRDE